MDHQKQISVIGTPCLLLFPNFPHFFLPWLLFGCLCNTCHVLLRRLLPLTMHRLQRAFELLRYENFPSGRGDTSLIIVNPLSIRDPVLPRHFPAASAELRSHNALNVPVLQYPVSIAIPRVVHISIIPVRPVEKPEPMAARTVSFDSVTGGDILHFETDWNVAVPRISRTDVHLVINVFEELWLDFVQKLFERHVCRGEDGDNECALVSTCLVGKYYCDAHGAGVDRPKGGSDWKRGWRPRRGCGRHIADLQTRRDFREDGCSG